MKQKKETAGKTAKKFEGVMLALRIEDAKEIKLLLSDRSYCNDEFVAKISNRIQKQINNREAQGLGYPRGVKQMQEEGALQEKKSETMIREISSGDAPYAACNTKGCPNGAQFELCERDEHMNDSVIDCRCEEHAAELGWKIPTEEDEVEEYAKKNRVRDKK